MARKRPRRTAERIRDTSLELFNRFGEPNVSTTVISAELRISPGNLYYHYPSKDELINTLFEEYEQALVELLAAADDVQDVEDAWFFLHSLFERIWEYRFLYRDLNHLLSRNRKLEMHFPALLMRKKGALRTVLEHLRAQSRPADADAPAPADDEQSIDAIAASMVVLLTYWLSYEYVLQPRSALEPENAQDALLRGAYHVLSLLLPHLGEAARAHLSELLQAYRAPSL